jgi:integrase
MRKTLSDKGVAALKPRAERYAYSDPELTGHWVRIHPSGARAYYAVGRTPSGKQVWHQTGDASVVSITESRERTRVILNRIKIGLPAVEPQGESFAATVESWLKRHVDANGLRSAREIRRLLQAHVLPAWGERPFLGIRRGDVASLLDDVEDNHSPRQADQVLTIIRAMMSWFAARHDDYVPVVVAGMRRQSPHAQRRARILSDDEIGKLWKAADAAGPFGGIVQTLLLTGQRRSKVVRMKWTEIDGDVWKLPLEPREKGNGESLKLPPSALAIIKRQPRFAAHDFVFPGRKGPLIGIDNLRRKLAERSGVTGWSIHDLRRTARSLMSRAGIPAEHAERVLGHAIGGVEGTYDRHSYLDEKAHALAKLANLIGDIVHPRDKVIALRGKRR